MHVCSHSKPATHLLDSGKLVISNHLDIDSKFENFADGFYTVMPWKNEQGQRTNKLSWTAQNLFTLAISINVVQSSLLAPWTVRKKGHFSDISSGLFRVNEHPDNGSINGIYDFQSRKLLQRARAHVPYQHPTISSIAVILLGMAPC